MGRRCRAAVIHSRGPAGAPSRLPAVRRRGLYPRAGSGAAANLGRVVQPAAARRLRAGAGAIMNLQRIDDFDDPRVDLYRNLKDRELERRGRHFIAEGEYIDRRLLASDFPVESVLLAERRADEIAPIVPPHVPIYVMPHELMNRILGV